VAVATPDAALEVIEKVPEVIDAYLSGARVHAVFWADGGERAFAESLIAALQSQGFADVSAVRVEPTIDDVFVSLVSSQRATPSEYRVRSTRHRAQPRRKAEWTVRRLAVRTERFAAERHPLSSRGGALALIVSAACVRSWRSSSRCLIAPLAPQGHGEHR
jgi:hypothetical protein